MKGHFMMKKRITITFLITVCIATLLTSCSFSKKQNDDTNSVENAETTQTNDEWDDDYFPKIDAEEYIASFGTIENSYTASEQESMLSEREVMEILSDRGFWDCPVYSHYTRDGEYYDNTEITADSDVKHPNYDLQYTTPNGDIWNIFIIKDTLYASPISFILSEESDCNIIYTESNLLFFYDNVTDKYYEVESNSNDIKVITNAEITANTLDNITIEEMKKS